jgi:hypothetical protein
MKMLTRNYSVTKISNPYLIGAKIIDTFVLHDGDADRPAYEGGLTIIFEKDNERGILIYGYTDLGEWIDFLQVGNKVICDGLIKYYEKTHRLSQLLKEYRIETAGHCEGAGNVPKERDL